MPTFTLQGRVTPDHKLEVQLPPDVPVGAAQVTVSVELDGRGELGSPERFLATLRKIHSRPGRTYRTKEDIDRALQEERDSWGDT
jgi:hypothetical protein